MERPNGARLVLGDCRMAADLAPDLVGQVTLAVTSPPYHNAISYESHAANPDANYRPRERLSYSGVYLPLLGAAWDATNAMLRPGGLLAVNVGTVLLDGYQYPLPQDVINQFSNSKEWRFVGSIVWNKVTAGVKRAGTVIQKPHPGYWHPNIMTEHIILARKRGRSLTVNRDVPSEWWEPVWDLAPVPPGQVDHPAPFPEDLPHRLIRMFTVEGDVVMDPFNGAGATTKAAIDLSRRALGFDLEPSYIEYAQARLATASAVRPSQLLVRPVPAATFKPGPSRGRTRHGAGLATRRAQSS